MMEKLDYLMAIVLGVLLILTLLFGIMILVEVKKVRKWMKTVKGDLKKSVDAEMVRIDGKMEEVRKSTNVILDGLLLAQTNDKAALVKLVSEKREVKPEVIKEIKEEIKKEKLVKEEKLEPVKKPYTPID